MKSLKTIRNLIITTFLAVLILIPSGVTVHAQTIDAAYPEITEIEGAIIPVPQQYIDIYGIENAAVKYQEDLIWLAKIVYHESGNQDYDGKRLCADTVLNRWESGRCGSTISSVIFQPGQFTTAKYLNYYTDECLQAAVQEATAIERLDSQVWFFCSTGFNQYGKPAFRHGGHWFSYY